MLAKSFRPFRALPALGLAASLLGGGCAENESTVFIRGVLALAPGECVFSSDPSSMMRTGGVIDLAFRSDYTAGLLVGNQLVTRGNRDTLRTESSRIALEGAVIEVRTPTGEMIQEYTVDGTGFVDPGDGSEPGYGVMTVQLIPAGVPLPTNRINVGIRVFGTTLGGREVESNQLTFPVSVCTGCLISYPSDALDPGTGECRGGEAPADPAPCVGGQDDAIDCRYCSGSNELCLRPGG